MGGSGNKSPIAKSFDSYSKYDKQHKETVDFVKKQTGVDLNKYRDGDGTSRANTTAYWDKDGVKVAFNHKAVTKTDMQKLKQLTTKYDGKVVIEEGGAWFSYIHLKHQFK